MWARGTRRPCSIWRSDQKQVAAVEADLKSLKAMRAESADLRALIGSPAFSAEDKGKGLAAIAEARRFNATTKKFLGLLAANRRASVAALGDHRLRGAGRRRPRRGLRPGDHRRAADRRPVQGRSPPRCARRSARTPKSRPASTPPSSAGIKVRVGSRLFDASLKSKLDSLKFALKRA